MYKVKYKIVTAAGDHNSAYRELEYCNRNSSAYSQIYYFFDRATGEMFSFYRRLTANMLHLVNTMQKDIVFILRGVSQFQYTYRLGARGRDL